MNGLLVFAVVLAFCTSCAAQEPSVEKLLAQSEPAIQELIGKVSEALNQSSRDPQNNIKARQEIKKLQDSIADKGEIVKQVVIFASSPTSDEHRPLFALMILRLLDPPSKVVIPVLAPYLNAENKNLRSFVRDWFQGHDNGGSGSSRLKPVNYEDYADYVRAKINGNEEIPPAFIEYIYERSPDRALLVFNRADRRGKTVDRLRAMRKELEQQGNDVQDKLPQPRAGMGRSEILLAEHTIGNAIWLKKHSFDKQFPEALPEAKQQLSRLAGQDQWWVRLYVAEIMRRHRELRQADVLKKLRHDSNALVSKSAKSARE